MLTFNKKDCALQVHKKNPVCPFCRRPYDLPLSDTNKDVVALVDQYLQKKSGMDVEKPTTPSIIQDVSKRLIKKEK